VIFLIPDLILSNIETGFSSLVFVKLSFNFFTLDIIQEKGGVSFNQPIALSLICFISLIILSSIETGFSSLVFVNKFISEVIPDIIQE
jgi:hypothetical protein